MYFPLESPRSILRASLSPTAAPPITPRGPATARPIKTGTQAATNPVKLPYFAELLVIFVKQEGGMGRDRMSDSKTKGGEAAVSEVPLTVETGG